MALVASILKGETSVAEAAPKHGLTGAVSGRGGERPAESPARRRGVEGGADQEAETEDRGSRPRKRYLTGGLETVPLSPEDIRRVRAGVSGVSERRSCQVLGVGRACLHRPAVARGRRQRTDPPWTERLRQLIQQHPTFGYRRLWVLLRLSPAAGVHHALYAGAEWDDRTVFSEPERGVCLATHVPDVCGGAANHSELGPVVQPRAGASGAGVSEPSPISGATINAGGLISGEHYMLSNRQRRHSPLGEDPLTEFKAKTAVAEPGV